jgi:hypothetical protein
MSPATEIAILVALGSICTLLFIILATLRDLTDTLVDWFRRNGR